MSNDWIERSDSLIELMKEKNIPIGLLGARWSFLYRESHFIQKRNRKV